MISLKRKITEKRDRTHLNPPNGNTLTGDDENGVRDDWIVHVREVIAQHDFQQIKLKWCLEYVQLIVSLEV